MTCVGTPAHDYNAGRTGGEQLISIDFDQNRPLYALEAIL